MSEKRTLWSLTMICVVRTVSNRWHPLSGQWCNLISRSQCRKVAYLSRQKGLQ